MSEYQKRQEDYFSDLKDILEEKGMTETIRGYLARMEETFFLYIVADLDWEMIHLKAISFDGKELEDFLSNVTEMVESYIE